jgi:hypothetical protein
MLFMGNLPSKNLPARTADNQEKQNSGYPDSYYGSDHALSDANLTGYCCNNSFGFLRPIQQNLIQIIT